MASLESKSGGAGPEFTETQLLQLLDANGSIPDTYALANVSNFVRLFLTAPS